MWSRNRFSFLPLCALLLAPLGCGDDADEPAQMADAGHPHEAGAHDEEFEDVPCNPATHFPLMPGLSAPVGNPGGMTVRIVSSDPMRARQKVRNDWVIEVLDANGVPVPDVELTDAAAWMEVHKHYGLPAPKVMKQVEPGRFLLDNINFSMRGPWDVQLRLERGDARPESANLSICVD
jgi:hypothetical protein